MGRMTQAAIDAYRTDGPVPDRAAALRRAREAMIATGQWRPSQVLGRRWAIGCVALEITQRCNLDCSLCYLSDHAEAVKDLPLEEIWRRIDLIRDTYGAGTNVQVTGGDPTLRDRAELVAIVRRVRGRGLLPALFTNGIRATRSLLIELRDAGLVDVAFHVDTTQGRRGYATEADLHALRRAYIERARGLGLLIYFNTTIHDGNAHEVADLARFFVANADTVAIASFQLQAATGRGTMGARDEALVSKDAIAEQLRTGTGGRLSFDYRSVGHTDCNRNAVALIAGGRTYDLFGMGGFPADLVRRATDTDIAIDRTAPFASAARLAGFLCRRPALALRGLAWLAGAVWGMRHGLLASRGRVETITFFIHDFMDADGLDCERIAACSFKVMTANGPVAMCLHNARRDEHLLRPIRLAAGKVWDPLTGRVGTRRADGRKSSRGEHPPQAAKGPDAGSGGAAEPVSFAPAEVADRVAARTEAATVRFARLAAGGG